MTSADSCRTREIDVVGTVGLVYFGEMLRMGVELSYCPCGDLLEVGSLPKGSQMCGKSGQLPDGQGTSTGAEWATSHS